MRRIKKTKRRKSLIFITSLIFIIGGIIMSGFIFYNNKELENNNKKETNKEQGKLEPSIKTEETIKKAPINSSEFKELADGEYLTEKKYILKIENGIATIDGHLIVNKTYALKEDYKPISPYQEITSERCNNCINKEVMKAFNLMKSDATAVGLNIYIASGYRSYNYQTRLYNNYTSVSGIEKADTYSARPGHSEHQTGLCFDLNSVDDSFANTDEGKWIDKNAHLYGFIVRYPKGKESVTGYQYESWHLRYVGTSLAKELYNNGSWITMEEYFGINSSY